MRGGGTATGGIGGGGGGVDITDVFMGDGSRFGSNDFFEEISSNISCPEEEFLLLEYSSEEEEVSLGHDFAGTSGSFDDDEAGSSSPHKSSPET